VSVGIIQTERSRNSYISFEIREIMTYRFVCPVNNNQVVVTLPATFSNMKQVTVFVDDYVDIKSQKIEMMKMASNDPLFLADIKEIQEDFDSIDHETL
jgi:hypothetical protein